MTQWASVWVTLALPLVTTDESLLFSASISLHSNGYSSTYPVSEVLCESGSTECKSPPILVELPAALGKQGPRRML